MRALLLALLLFIPAAAWAGELDVTKPEDAALMLGACQAEASNLRELAQKYRSDDLSGDITIAVLRAQRDALLEEVKRLRGLRPEADAK